MSNYEEENDQITLTLEDDSELVCDVIATFPDDSEAEEIYLYRFEENGDDVDVQNILDDEEFEIVSDKFDELLDEEEFDELFDEDEDEE